MKRLLICMFLLTYFSIKADDFQTKQAPCTDLVVDCNLLMHDSTSAAVGNIVKPDDLHPGNPPVSFIHNFGSENTFVGKNAGSFFNLIGSDNSGFGVFALQNITSGTNNVAIGAVTLASNAEGSDNVAIGRAALNKNILDDNVAVGFRALENNKTGSSNTAVGARALLNNNDGQNNTAMGVGALRDNRSGSGNTAVGRRALQNNKTGINSTAIGVRALQLSSSGGNTAVGYQALSSNTVGTSNTAVGNNALQKNQSGSSNVAVGRDALRQNLSGSQNIAIGHQAGNNCTGAESNNILIGNLGIIGDNNTIRIGDSAHTKTFIAGISGIPLAGPTVLPVYVLSSGQLGTLVSSRKFKHSIREMHDNDSMFIYDLNPVTFVYNEDESATLQYGLIAEEVDRVFPALVIRDEHNEPIAVYYEILPVFLLNEMKKYNYDITKLKEAIDNIRALVLKRTKQPPCDVTVDCNLVMQDSTGATVGDVMKQVTLNASPVRFIHNYGAQNTFVGKNAGNFKTTGNGANSGFGVSALRALTTGTDNTAVGRAALRFNTAGIQNTAVGRSALNQNVIGNDNVAVGYNALSANVTGSSNTAVGSRALLLNTTGQDNTAMGTRALRANNGNANTAVGRSALRNGLTVTNSTAVGYRALEANNSNRNTAVGYKSLLVNLAGSFNTAIGNNSLQNNEAGSSNVAIGKDALLKNKFGSQNSAVGYQAGSNLDGAESTNIMIGNLGVTDDNNTIRIGNSSHAKTFIAGIVPLLSARMQLRVDSEGKLSKKMAMSSRRFKSSINSMNDIDVEQIYRLNPVSFVYNNDEWGTKRYGLIAEEVEEHFSDLVMRNERNELLGVRYDILPVLLLHEMKKHKCTIAQLQEVVADISARASKYSHANVGDIVVTRAACDTSVECNILMQDSTGLRVGNIFKDGQTFIHNFGTNAKGEYTNTFVGISAGNFNTSGNGGNSGFGFNALALNTTGTDNTALGDGTLSNNSVGSFNTAVGSLALKDNSTGKDNVAIGSGVLTSNSGGNANTAIGREALHLQDQGNDNTALGARALQFALANANTAIGAEALMSNGFGINSTAVGYKALSSNVTGDRNTAVGYQSLTSNNGKFNTAIGANSLRSNTAGSFNVAIGDGALLNSLNNDSNIAIGLGAGSTYAFSASNNIVIGNAGALRDNNTIRIGNNSHKAVFIAGIPQLPLNAPEQPQVFVNSSGQLGVQPSSRKYKHDINKIADDSEGIYNLKPVTFMYNDDESAEKQYGLIAEEVDEVLSALVVRDGNNEPLSVRYDMLPVLLLNELKKQHEDVMMLEKMAVELQKELVCEN